MSLKQQLMFWLVTLLVFVALLWLLSDILLPFVAGVALAYLQSPLVDWLERQGLNRALGSLIVITLVVLAIVVLVLLLVPILINQVLGFIANVPDYYDRLKGVVAELPWLQQSFQQIDTKKAVDGIIGSSATATALVTLWAGGKSVVSFVSLLVVMPVVTFYHIVRTFVDFPGPP
jgi:predicted PurR-regulated permease PerM